MSTANIKAYESVNKASLSGRELEASALIRAAALLKECQDNWTAAGREERLNYALQHNQKLWTIFQSELAQPDHPLPVTLRRDLLSLSQFIDRRIFEILAFPSPEKLTAIIQINREVAAGLRVAPTGR